MEACNPIPEGKASNMIDSNKNNNEDAACSDSSDNTFDGEPSANKKEGKKEDEEEEVIAKAETIIVFKLRLTVLGVLLCSAIGVAIAVSLYISRNERRDFESQFHDDAIKVLDSIGSSLDLTLGAVDGLVVSMVSFAKYTNQQWPFVTIPDFAVRAQKMQSLSKAVLISLYPMVSDEQRKEYELFTSLNNGWVMDGILKQAADVDYKGPIIYNYTTWDVIHGNDEYYKENPGEEGTNETGPYFPVWQVAPVVPRYAPYNWNLLTSADPKVINAIIETHKVSLGPANLVADLDDEEFDIEADYLSDFIDPGEEAKEPLSEILYPILDVAIETTNLYDSSYYSHNTNTTSDEDYDHSQYDSMLRGLLVVSIYWRDMIKNTLPEGSNGILVVIENECNPTFSYQINGPRVTYLGKGDKHDSKYDYLEQSTYLLKKGTYYSGDDRSYTGVPVMDDVCPFLVRLFPSDVMLDDYVTSNRISFTIAAILIFLFTSTVFILYDCMVERRQRKVMKSAVRSNKIVSSLFPSNVRDQLYPAIINSAAGGGEDNDEVVEEESMGVSTRKRLQSFLSNDSEFLRKEDQPKKPIAEIFPETTVFFADIAGFTAWSSIREPTQVFHLLEVLFGAFDGAARKHSVFKVETIGDCYVAVTGLPVPQKRHAVIMVKFAAECRDVMIKHTRELETTLGPGTGNLRLRLGVHSGPTTAGVLRGDKCRFQLFGDTVNTAARMESLGQRDRIHASQKTADLIVTAGKTHWLVKREDVVDAKGKGQMQTYWVEPKGDYSASLSSNSSQATHPSTADTNTHQKSNDSAVPPGIADDDCLAKDSTLPVDIDRLVDWNVTLFEELLKNIMADRVASDSLLGKNGTAVVANEQKKPKCAVTMVRDEVLEFISLPEYSTKKKKKAYKKSRDIVLSPTARSQLRGFIYDIASSYRPNAFHNFEHACHVTMSTKKLLQRVVTPDISAIGCAKNNENSAVTNKDVHDYTFGITSDPLTQFTIVLAALIHDVDHPGVSNAQLVKEKAAVAIKYNNKSVAEQNSIDFAWELLTDSKNSDLLACIYSNEMEQKRFRQLLVNAVMATDIFDKELKELRELRWQKAFHPTTTESHPDMDNSGRGRVKSKLQDTNDVNRKATIVIEYIIQASDVAHTMQHWKIYQKWNRCLFEEMYVTYKMGRSEKDPSIGWYAGELWFFDNYIIPLAKKLKECEVFGVSCDEFLDFAQDNRLEWEGKGQGLVEEMKQELESKYTDVHEYVHAESLPI